MHTKINLSHLITGVVLGGLLWSGVALAGEPDSPGSPDSTVSFSLEALYRRLAAGEPGAQSAFTEPSGGPGAGTMHSIDEIMAVAPAPDNANGASRSEVLSGATYWGLTNGEWGLRIGTGNLASGDATDTRVFEGVSYSSADGPSTGTMPDRGAVDFTPGTSVQPVPAGYHNGSGRVAGDGDWARGGAGGGASGGAGGGG